MSWTEERHQALESIDPEIARDVLEEMDDELVELNVNARQFQQDYICDFLEWMWDVSTKSFWRHVEAICRHPEGIVIGDNDKYLEIIEREILPTTTWHAMLHSVLVTTPPGMEREILGEIVVMRLKERPLALACRTWMDALPAEQRIGAEKTLASLRATPRQWRR